MSKQNQVSEKIRLDRFLSSQLYITRNEAKKLLRSKSVQVNLKPCSDAGFTVVTGEDKIYVNGQEVIYRRNIYIMQNKPAGVVSASASPGDTTVIDILPEKFKRQGLFPAGRLDKDTTGFVLITDDGAFAHDILSPVHHVPKTYTVTLSREVTKEEMKMFSEGITIGDEKFKPASLKPKDGSDVTYVYLITITEGRYHQIKRMFASTGNRVIALHRDKIGNLSLDTALKPGQSRMLSEAEISVIRDSI